MEKAIGEPLCELCASLGCEVPHLVILGNMAKFVRSQRIAVE